MRMYFNNREAREFLLKHGFVFTAREHRDIPHIRSKVDLYNGAEFLGKGVKVFVGSIYLESDVYLEDYLPLSGFKKQGDWSEAIIALHGDREIYDLYYVYMVSGNGEEVGR